MKKLIALAAFAALAACGQKEAAAPSSAPAAGAQTAQAETPSTPEARGKRQFNECAACHPAAADKGHMVGPNLYGVIGRTAGTAEGFSYSRAMKDSGIIWTEETLDGYIENPQAYLPGNRMSFAGQRDAQKRADIIAYLKSISAN
ncbi:MAG: cytochrome c family protein [Parvularculaceae bacterium]